MPDNNTPQGPTYFGQKSKQGIIGQTFFPQGTDPILNYIQRLNPLQQLSQAGSTGLGAYRQAFGYNAPSIEPIRREEQRIFQQETLPQLMENLAGGGSQGALYRGIQGAQGDIATRLGALRQQQQFELQKQRQGDLARFRELEMQPTHQPHITNLPLAGQPNEPFARKNIEKAGRVAQGLGGELAQKGLETAEKGVQEVSDSVFNQLRKYSPELAHKFKDIQLKVGKKYQGAKAAAGPMLKGIQERAEKYAKKPVVATKARLPKGPKEIAEAKKAYGELPSNIKPLIHEDLKESLSPKYAKVIKKWSADKKKSQYIPYLDKLRNEDQLEGFVKIINKVFETTKGRKRKLAQFLQSIEKGNE